MPYLSDERKEALAEGDVMRKPGELNYTVTRCAILYLQEKRDAGVPMSYQLLAETISQVEEAAAEMRRRLLIPYEKNCIKRNGDVYPDWLLIAVGAEEAAKLGPAIAYEAHPGYVDDKLRHTNVGPLPPLEGCPICYGNDVACQWPHHKYGQCLRNPKRKES